MLKLEIKSNLFVHKDGTKYYRVTAMSVVSETLATDPKVVGSFTFKTWGKYTSGKFTTPLNPGSGGRTKSECYLSKHLAKQEFNLECAKRVERGYKSVSIGEPPIDGFHDGSLSVKMAKLDFSPENFEFVNRTIEEFETDIKIAITKGRTPWEETPFILDEPTKPEPAPVEDRGEEWGSW